MKIAIASKNFTEVSAHAGQSRHWLLYDSAAPIPSPTRVTLAAAQVFHVFADDGPHPLDGVDLVIAASAGDGFLRHMARRGSEVVLTGERNAEAALQAVLSGAVLPDTRFDPTRVLCRVRDLFSRY